MTATAVAPETNGKGKHKSPPPGEQITDEVVILVDPFRVRRFANQPRKWFDPDALKALSGSIQSEGQITPCEIKRITGDPNHNYELIDGERRWRAIQMIDGRKMKAIVKKVVNEQRQFVDSFLGNMAREGHQPVEIALAINYMLTIPDYQGKTRTESLERIATASGKSVAWAYQHLNLLELHEKVMAMLGASVPEKKRLGFSTAVYLNTVPDKEMQLEIAKEIVAKELKVNDARSYIRKRMREVGLEPTAKSGRRRKPSEDFEPFVNLMVRMEDGVQRMDEMTPDQFLRAFKGKTPETRKKLLGRMDAIMGKLGTIRRTMHNNLKV